MNKLLICYFSATGTTKRVAEKLSEILNGDLFEIEPVNKYTKDDLDWTNKQSRSTYEGSLKHLKEMYSELNFVSGKTLNHIHENEIKELVK